MSEKAIRYEIAPLRLYVIGALMVLFWVPFAAAFILRGYLLVTVETARSALFADLMLAFGTLFFGGLAIYAIGLAWRKPVGLRLDAHGVSGYFAPSLQWEDIRAIPARSIKQRVLIDLKDPQSFWATQPLWTRINNALSFQANMVQINTGPIRAESGDIIDALREMHARYGS